MRSLNAASVASVAFAHSAISDDMLREPMTRRLDGWEIWPQFDGAQTCTVDESKTCTMCGGVGHLAKDCPWSRDLAGLIPGEVGQIDAAIRFVASPLLRRTPTFEMAVRAIQRGREVPTLRSLFPSLR